MAFALHISECHFTFVLKILIEIIRFLFRSEKEKPMTCPICTADNEDILLQTPNLRVHRRPQRSRRTGILPRYLE